MRNNKKKEAIKNLGLQTLFVSAAGKPLILKSWFTNSMCKTSFFSKAKTTGPVFSCFATKQDSSSFLKKRVEYLDHYNRSNQDTCLIHKPAVTIGEWVESGDLLADSSASMNGELAIGKNILVAYMPWEGYNYEDAILINERLVYDDVYTSIHIERYEIETKEGQLGSDQITREIPELSPEAIAHLDSNGIAKVGSWIEEGDILVGKVTPINKKNQTPYQKLLFKLLVKRLNSGATRDSSLRAPKGIKANVIKVHILSGVREVLQKERPGRKASQTKKTAVSEKQQNITKNVTAPQTSKQGSGFAKAKPIIKEVKQKPFTRHFKSASKNINLSYGFAKAKPLDSQFSRFCFSKTVNLKTWLKGSSSNSTGKAFHPEHSKGAYQQLSNEEMSIPTNLNLYNSSFNIWKNDNKKLKSKNLFFTQFKGPSAQQGKAFGFRQLKAKLANPALLKTYVNTSYTDLIYGFAKAKPCSSGRPYKTNGMKSKNSSMRALGLGLTVKQNLIPKSPTSPLNSSKQKSKATNQIFKFTPTLVHIYLAEKRKIQVGDKMAGRHGNKGIISNILPREDMPFLPDGTPIDIVLNPLGVPSRMNVGQIYECLLGLAGKYLGEHFKIFPFDEIYGPEASRSFVFAKLFEARKKTGVEWLFDPNSPGKMRIFDGRTSEVFDQPVTVGIAYMLKLVHMVDDKIHARSIGPYSLVTQQPLRGRAKQGGQRLGEMEVWAIEGYGAAFVLLEMLTLKSDDMTGRLTLWSNLILNKEITIGTPESFKVLVCELQALCLDIGLFHFSKISLDNVNSSTHSESNTVHITTGSDRQELSSINDFALAKPNLFDTNKQNAKQEVKNKSNPQSLVLQEISHLMLLP
jgi:DNA-directed RNA polymerase subunit beta